MILYPNILIYQMESSQNNREFNYFIVYNITLKLDPIDTVIIVVYTYKVYNALGINHTATIYMYIKYT